MVKTVRFAAAEATLRGMLGRRATVHSINGHISMQ